MRRSNRPTRFALVTLSASATATLLGAAWYVDARRRSRQSSLLHRTLVELMLNTLNSGDAFTERHCRRVADLTDSLACACGFDRRRRATLRVASLLHDMGKLDDELFDIVHSTQRLGDEERRRIRQHPRESADILQPLEAFHQGLADIVQAHHERWDGTGYPGGLRGEQIPLESRILSIADVFDALTQPRKYKPARSVEDALAEIRAGAGARFDPAVVAQLDRADILDEWIQIARRGWEEEGREME